MFDIFRGFGMEVLRPNGVLKVTERGFNSPSEVVNIFDMLCGKFPVRKVRYDVFVYPFCYLETDYPQRHMVFCAGFREEIERDRLTDTTVYGC